MNLISRLSPLAAILVTAIFVAGNSEAAADLTVKPASSATIAEQIRIKSALPSDNGQDLEFATRGFIATRKDPIIRNQKGDVAWDLSAFDYVKGDAPASVHPALWRQMGLLRHHGLYTVGEGIWQVRGFDVSNMTIVRGKTGWIIIDPLTTRETAAAALQLINDTLGHRPVTAVMYTHSHGDHFGGVRSIVDENDIKSGKVRIYAPKGFTEESASENIMAAPVTVRRGVFQFGIGIKPGPLGNMGTGLSASAPAGELTLITPTDIVEQTGEKRTIDGVSFEFQMVSGSEAPAEFNVYIEVPKVFLSAEISVCAMHNILTPRGAKVRDAKLWAGYLDEALQRYGKRSDALIASHCWPRYGQDEISNLLASQRDNYRYLHDQTVRLMNRGQTPAEIAETLTQPEQLSREWFNHGFYGAYKHNAKAVYQYYLGWYDAVPANLDPLPPEERAKRMVEVIGGAGKILATARKAMDAGDYRWSSDLLNQLVFAEPENTDARAMLADSYEQQGYQAESALWRNQFLAAANELRNGRIKPMLTQNQDMLVGVPTQLLLDSVATRFAPERLGDKLYFNIVMPEREETISVELTGTVMLVRPGASPSAAATITGPRTEILDMLFPKKPLAELEKQGLNVKGDRAAVQRWLEAIDPEFNDFNIALP
ncbi:alkyl/aryl-sulfatase [Brenneria izbisi]|uniref:MBL fold metallo-hydrolase n=1 Tax=Brenneria izbisi TaxID=2939450 RepID=A0AA41XYK0_9GAMM|nr:alkyl sulfatase dimerization domain-containing protein [Brenneria izbisi]MCV9879585.1 MBL fold metallo-hydrolase [Brenneria izbisi]MCV9882974.1 MBL fold metallo-hydrolase [Brenneria izbisi]